MLKIKTNTKITHFEKGCKLDILAKIKGDFDKLYIATEIAKIYDKTANVGYERISHNIVKQKENLYQITIMFRVKENDDVKTKR